VLKVFASLIGVILTLGGTGAILGAIYIGAGYLFTTSSGPRLAGTAPSHFSLPAAIALGFGGVIAVYLGTQLGRFARGDFD